jgi:hypothetical protein
MSVVLPDFSNSDHGSIRFRTIIYSMKHVVSGTASLSETDRLQPVRMLRMSHLLSVMPV